MPLAAALFAVPVGYGAVLPVVPPLLDAPMPGASREAASACPLRRGRLLYGNMSRESFRLYAALIAIGAGAAARR